MLEAINEFLTRFGQVAIVLSIAFALLQCFLGYKLLKVWVAVIGFVAGFAIGFAVSSIWITDNAYLPAVIGLAAGILLALVAFRLYLVGVFIFCGFIVFAVVQTIPHPDEQAWEILILVLGIVAFIVAGILAVKFSRPCIIAITAICGAFNAVHSMSTPIPALAANYALSLVVSIVIAALGIAVQTVTTKDAGKRKR